MRPVAIVTMAKYPDIFATFAESVRKHVVADRQIVVVDGTWDVPAGWVRVQGPKKFLTGLNRNLGWFAAGDCDILDCGDDIQFEQDGVLETLREVAYSVPEIGLVSPVISGGCHPAQRDAKEQADAPYLAFICTYVKHATVERVGLIDERFVGYGPEDIDYCVRVRNEGMRVVVTPRARIHHGVSRDNSDTYMRAIGSDELLQQNQRGIEMFRRKWGRGPFDKEN